MCLELSGLNRCILGSLVGRDSDAGLCTRPTSTPLVGM